MLGWDNRSTLTIGNVSRNDAQVSTKCNSSANEKLFGKLYYFALIEFSWCEWGSATLLSESALVDLGKQQLDRWRTQFNFYTKRGKLSNCVYYALECYLQQYQLSSYVCNGVLTSLVICYLYSKPFDSFLTRSDPIKLLFTEIDNAESLNHGESRRHMSSVIFLQTNVAFQNSMKK